jgi:HEAT repeat protein
MLQNNNYKRYSATLLVVFVAMLFTSNINAQEAKSNSHSFSKNDIENLNNGIKSDNLGLRRSSIYFAGKYLLKESSKNLLDQLKIEDDKSIRILIVKVLYLIGNDEFMDDIYLVATKDEDVKVRKFASSVYSIMKLERSINIADVNK